MAMDGNLDSRAPRTRVHHNEEKESSILTPPRLGLITLKVDYPWVLIISF